MESEYKGGMDEVSTLAVAAKVKLGSGILRFLTPGLTRTREEVFNYKNWWKQKVQDLKRMNDANKKLMRIQKWKLLIPCRAYKGRKACRKGQIVGIQLAENTRI